MRIIFFFLLFLFSVNAYSQLKESFFYRTDGKLKADTTYKISKYRLKKWTAYEDSILNFVSKNLSYPAMEREAGIQGYLIVSFEIDDKGNIGNFIHEGDSASIDFKRTKYGCSKECCRVLASLPSNYLNGLKAPKGKTVKYYLPFHFIIMGANCIRKLVIYESYMEIITYEEWPIREFEN